MREIYVQLESSYCKNAIHWNRSSINLTLWGPLLRSELKSRFFLCLYFTRLLDGTHVLHQSGREIRRTKHDGWIVYYGTKGWNKSSSRQFIFWIEQAENQPKTRRMDSSSYLNFVLTWVGVFGSYENVRSVIRISTHLSSDWSSLNNVLVMLQSPSIEVADLITRRPHTVRVDTGHVSGLVVAISHEIGDYVTLVIVTSLVNTDMGVLYVLQCWNMNKPNKPNLPRKWLRLDRRSHHVV